MYFISNRFDAKSAIIIAIKIICKHRLIRVQSIYNTLSWSKFAAHWNNYAHGLHVVLVCLGKVWVDFTLVLEGYLTGAGVTTRLSLRQWSKPEEKSHNDMNTTKQNKTNQKHMYILLDKLYHSDVVISLMGICCEFPSYYLTIFMFHLLIGSHLT